MANNVTTFLMFEGSAEQAMKLYTLLFECSEITEVERYGADEQGIEGLIKRAHFTLHGREYICSDSPVSHDFGLTPATSIFVECDDDDELSTLFEKLSDGGDVLMPLDDYGFSKMFGWINDKFGVSWQLNLA